VLHEASQVMKHVKYSCESTHVGEEVQIMSKRSLNRAAKQPVDPKYLEALAAAKAVLGAGSTKMSELALHACKAQTCSSVRASWLVGQISIHFRRGRRLFVMVTHRRHYNGRNLLTCTSSILSEFAEDVDGRLI